MVGTACPRCRNAARVPMSGRGPPGLPVQGLIDLCGKEKCGCSIREGSSRLLTHVPLFGRPSSSISHRHFSRPRSSSDQMTVGYADGPTTRLDIEASHWARGGRRDISPGIAQKVMPVRTPTIAASPTRLPGRFEFSTPPPGLKTYCRLGWTCHQGVICA